MEQHDKMMTVSWGKFAAMITTSVVAMFFLMYQLVTASTTRRSA